MRCFRPDLFAALVGFGSIGAVAPLGCASILGLDDTTLGEDASRGMGDTGGGPDGGGTDARFEPSACDPPPADAGFIVQWTTGSVLPDGEYVKCAKSALPSEMVEVLVLTNAGFVRAGAGVSVQGALVFAGLPDGERYVHVPSLRQVYAVRGHRLDIGYDEVGRPDATPGKGEALRMTGNASSSAGVRWKLGGTFSSPPLTPTGSPPSWSFPFQNAPLLDGTKGDVVWLLGTKADDAIRGEKVVEACTLPNPVTMRAGEGTDVSVTCATVPLRDIEMGDAWRGFAREMPGGLADEGVVHLDMAPSDEPYRTRPNARWDDARSEENRLARATITSTTGNLTFHVMDPAPDKWTLTAEQRVWKSHSIVQTDGATSTTQWQDVLSSAQAIIQNKGQGWSFPAFPKTVTIGNIDLLQGPAVGVGSMPILAITTTSTGAAKAPTGYRISILEAATGTKRYEIITSQPKVTLPALSPPILEDGKEYVLAVTTRYAAGLSMEPTVLYSEEEPWRVVRRNDMRIGYMTRVTNAFTR